MSRTVINTVGPANFLKTDLEILEKDEPIKETDYSSNTKPKKQKKKFDLPYLKRPPKLIERLDKPFEFQI